MSSIDSRYISKEKHELDYVLRKWGKRTTQGNREVLAAALDRFKSDPTQAPHTRDLFYAYAERTGLASELESMPAGEAASVSRQAEPAPRKFRWWWVLLVLVVLAVLLFLLLRGCGASETARAGTPEAVPAAEASVPSTVPAAQQAPVQPVGRALVPGDLPAELRTLRFLPDSVSDMAPGEEPRLEALIAALRASGADRGGILIVGHAASIGYPRGEQAVSEGRARYIAARLGQAGLGSDITFAVEGRGAAEMLPGPAPAASRRVELSVR